MAAEVLLQPFPPFGTIAQVREPSWAALAAAIRAHPQLAFDTARYPYFDRVIAENARITALYNSMQSQYPLYAGLRFNIVALRNALACNMAGASTTAEKRRAIPRLKNIAGALGDALAKGDINPHTAGIMGGGAAEMYEYLLYIQDQPGIISGVRDMLRQLGGKRRLNFAIPGIELSPFSAANLAPAKTIPTSVAKLVNSSSEDDGEEELRSLESEGEKMAVIAEQLIDVAIQLDRVEDMAEPAKEESIEEARKILRWLRNLQATDRDMEEWIGQGTPAASVSKASKLQQIVQTFVQMLRRKPDASGDGAVREAVEAIRSIALFVGEEAVRMLPENNSRGIKLNALLDGLPDSWEKRSAQPVSRLLDIVEAALERVSGQQVSDLSVGEKLMQANNNIQKNLLQIRGKVDGMQSPAREESVELARDILDKLKNAGFSKKTPKEMVEKSTPEEKLEMAKRVDEGVQAYANLVHEASQKNPDSFFTDQRIKEASDAAHCFAHTVALMAVKEMPGSVAAAQQISSEAARDPDEWKKLHSHTVDRLVKSMEGGVEKAANDIGREQEEQKQEEQGQEAAQEAAQQSEGNRKKRRRRRASSGKGTGRARKAVLDISADDRALGQGRFSEERQGGQSQRRSSSRSNSRADSAAVPEVSLSSNDMAAVREVAGALLSATDNNRNPLTVTDVSASDKIVPDDKTQKERFSDREKQGQNRPKNPGKRN